MKLKAQIDPSEMAVVEVLVAFIGHLTGRLNGESNIPEIEMVRRKRTLALGRPRVEILEVDGQRYILCSADDEERIKDKKIPASALREAAEEAIDDLEETPYIEGESGNSRCRLTFNEEGEIIITLEGRRHAIKKVWPKLLGPTARAEERIEYNSSAPWLKPWETMSDGIDRLCSRNPRRGECDLMRDLRVDSQEEAMEILAEFCEDRKCELRDTEAPEHSVVAPSREGGAWVLQVPEGLDFDWRDHPVKSMYIGLLGSADDPVARSKARRSAADYMGVIPSSVDEVETSNSEEYSWAIISPSYKMGVDGFDSREEALSAAEDAVENNNIEGGEIVLDKGGDIETIEI